MVSKRTWIAMPSKVVAGGADMRCGPDPKQVQKETHDVAEASSGLHVGMKAVTPRDMEN